MSESPEKTLRKHVLALNLLLGQVRKDHPQACFYLAGDILHLLSGPSHDGIGSVRKESRSLASARLRFAGGGDW